MARPHRSRCICSLPTICEFSPKTGTTVRKNIIMTVDEYEVIRLIDLLELTQEECALQLEVSRTTVTAIYTAARRKLAQSIIEGETLLIQGGNIGGFKELAPILLVFHAKAFHIEEHDLGVIILLDIPDKVIEADIHLVADGGPAAVAHAALFGVEIQIDAEVAALQHEAHGAGGKVDDARVQADRRTVHPHAVGAHDAHV